MKLPRSVTLDWWDVAVFIGTVVIGGGSVYLQRTTVVSEELKSQILTGTLATILGFLTLLLVRTVKASLKAAMEAKVVPHASVILGQDDLIAKYEEMRKQQGATILQAIWSTDYRDVHVSTYFRKEFKDLKELNNLNIIRLINPATIPGGSMQEYVELFSQEVEPHDNIKRRYQHRKTDVKDFECFIVTYYTPDNERHVKALFVYNNPATGSKPMGLYIDSTTGIPARTAGEGLLSWFENLTQHEVDQATDFIQSTPINIAKASN